MELNDTNIYDVIRPLIIKYGEDVMVQILENAENKIDNEIIFYWFKEIFLTAMNKCDLDYFQEKDFEQAYLERKELTKMQQAARAARAARREEK